jgi:hypothetical protein
MRRALTTLGTISVYLAQTIHSNKKTEILGFECAGPIPHPYTLDNIANAGGSISLKLKWIDSTHLHVTYQGGPRVYFQAVKFGQVVITLEDLSAKTGENATPTQLSQ